MDIIVRVERAYGNIRYYPANELAENLLKLLDRKSFTKEQMLHLKASGFEVELKTETLEEEYATL